VSKFCYDELMTLVSAPRWTKDVGRAKSALLVGNSRAISGRSSTRSVFGCSIAGVKADWHKVVGSQGNFITSDLRMPAVGEKPIIGKAPASVPAR
jgi:hypothetical protein